MEKDETIEARAPKSIKSYRTLDERIIQIPQIPNQ
jgi:hypothetical protein